MPATLDTTETIVAVATAPGGAPRGVVRLSGPDALAVAGRLIGRPIEASAAVALRGVEARLPLGGSERRLPCDLLVWPDERSYTRQPSAEVHTVGSPPVLEAVVAAAITAGARLAEPGEFTLRALLAGRIDLVQAEGVLAVIDAGHDAALDAALEQLAGGLSGPLNRLREELLSLLADLEAGLDFVDEEDVRFVEPEELRVRLRGAAAIVDTARRQFAERGELRRRARVAIVGPPNVGKSRLFNALANRFGADAGRTEALVADQPGVTRDPLVATVRLADRVCELIDTPGDDTSEAIDAIDRAARSGVARTRASADLLLECRPTTSPPACHAKGDRQAIAVATMADRGGPRYDEGVVATSAVTGEGLDELAGRIAEKLADADASDAGATTAARAREGLAQGHACLNRAHEIAAAAGGDELVALELRQALDGVGRVVGAVLTDDILDRVFAKFCIGK